MARKINGKPRYRGVWSYVSLTVGYRAVTEGSVECVSSPPRENTPPTLLNLKNSETDKQINSENT